MKTVSALLIGCLFTHAGLTACVTYHPGTGTYTVNKNGCVDRSINKSQPNLNKK